MNYTIQKLATLTGTTVRTLRFYDEIGLLKPAYIAENGYRFYQEGQLVRLQQILFYRDLGYDLKQIQEIFADPHKDPSAMLEEQKELLLKNIKRQKRMIQTIENTLKRIEQAKTMTPQEMLKDFKDTLESHIAKKLGDGGEEIINAANKDVQEKTAGWTWAEHWTPYITQGKALITEFETLFDAKTKPGSPEVQRLAQKKFDHDQKVQTLDKQAVLQGCALMRDKKYQQLAGGASLYSFELLCFMADAMEIFANKNL